MKRKASDAVNVDAWMPLWIGDYHADTAALSTVQHGAYLLLLMAYWRNGGPLIDDDADLAAIAKLSRAQWLKHRPKLVVMFQVSGGFWSHKRVEFELANATELATKRRAKAEAAARARWGAQPEQGDLVDAPSNAPSNAPSTPEALLEQCPSPSPSPSPAVSSVESGEITRGRRIGRRALESGDVVQQIDLDDTAADAIAVIKGLRQLGVRASNIHDPRLLATLGEGVKPAAIVGLATELIDAHPSDAPPAFAYLLATARGRHADAQKEPVRNGHASANSRTKLSPAEQVLANIEARKRGAG